MNTPSRPSPQHPIATPDERSDDDARPRTHHPGRQEPGPPAIAPVSPFDPAVRELVARLDAYQIGLYGRAACNLEPLESLAEGGAYLLGAHLGGTLIGIGAVKPHDGCAELKRVYFVEAARGTGGAAILVRHLEAHAASQGADHVYLETGRLQHAAIRFYEKLGYARVDRFGSYAPNAVSVYMGKRLHRPRARG